MGEYTTYFKNSYLITERILASAIMLMVVVISTQYRKKPLFVPKLLYLISISGGTLSILHLMSCIIYELHKRKVWSSHLTTLITAATCNKYWKMGMYLYLLILCIWSINTPDMTVKVFAIVLLFLTMVWLYVDIKLDVKSYRESLDSFLLYSFPTIERLIRLADIESDNFIKSNDGLAYTVLDKMLRNEIDNYLEKGYSLEDLETMTPECNKSNNDRLKLVYKFTNQLKYLDKIRQDKRDQFDNFENQIINELKKLKYDIKDNIYVVDLE